MSCFGLEFAKNLWSSLSVINSVIRTGVSVHQLFVCNLQNGLEMASKSLAIDDNLTGNADYRSCVCLNERSPIKSWQTFNTGVVMTQAFSCVILLSAV